MLRGMPFRVVIAGGGVAGIEAALALRALASDLVTVELASPEPAFAYRPLVVSEPFGRGHVHMLDLREITADAGATLRIAGLAGVDDAGSRAIFDDGTSAEYDALVIACGTKLVAAVPGASTFAGIADVETYREILDDIDSGDVGSVAFVIPHGTVWPLPMYELALMTARRPAKHDAELTLVTPEDEPLDVLGPAATRAVSELLAEYRIALLTGMLPMGVQRRQPDARSVRHGQGRPVRGAARAARHRARRRPHGAGRLHPGRRARPRRGPHQRVRGGRYHQLLGEAGRRRRPAGRRRGRGHRRRGGSGHPSRAVPARHPKRAPHRERPALPLEPACETARELSSVATTQPFWSPPDKIAAPFLAPYLARRIDGALR